MQPKLTRIWDFHNSSHQHGYTVLTKTQNGILSYINEWMGAGTVICLERHEIDLHMVQLMPLPPHHLLLHQNPEWFTFLVPPYPQSPGKEAVKWVKYSRTLINQMWNSYTLMRNKSALTRSMSVFSGRVRHEFSIMQDNKCSSMRTFGTRSPRTLASFSRQKINVKNNCDHCKNMQLHISPFGHFPIFSKFTSMSTVSTKYTEVNTTL